MRLTFLLVYALIVAVLYLPGFLALRAFRLDWKPALACAPLPTVAVCSLLAAAYSRLGVPSSPVTLLGPVLAVCALLFAASLASRRKKAASSRGLAVHGARRRLFGSEGLLLMVTLAAGLVAVWYVFVHRITSGSFLQEYDNWYHLNMVRSFVDSGNFSSFSPSPYAKQLASGFVEPYPMSRGFYPSAWYALCALAIQATGAPVTVAINATNAALIGTVYPVGVWELLRELFPNRRHARWFGALACVSFAAFPWELVDFGPLYPNLLANALVPAAAACFVGVLRDGASVRVRVADASLFLTGCVALLFAQPNGIFTMAVFLAPYLVSRACAALRARGCAPRVVLAGGVLVFAGVVAIWTLFYNLPFFQPVVSFVWPATIGRVQAAVNVLTLSLGSNIQMGFSGVQLLLAALVLAGLAQSLRSRRLRWVGCSYLFVAFSYAWSVSADGSLKQFLTGFWYTDPKRLAANIAIVGVPLAALGMASAFRLVQGALSCLASRRRAARPSRLAAVSGTVVVAVMAALVFMPNHKLMGMFDVMTAFGGLTRSISACYDVSSNENVLSSSERAFCERALAIVGTDDLVLNEPNDGSGYLYGLDGMNVYYRAFALPSSKADETRQSDLIRNHLDEVSYNADVQEALRSLGARYLLVLDQGDTPSEGEKRRWLWSYFPDQWPGIEAVRDDTPGFTAVLSQGDMRLYKIEY